MKASAASPFGRIAAVRRPTEQTDEEKLQGLERLIVNAMSVSIFVYLVGDGFGTIYVVDNYLDPQVGNIYRVHAVGYGVPLILAALLGVMRGARTRFPLSGFLDPLVKVMIAYWAFSSAVGWVAGNETRVWASTSFNFQVPGLTYLALRSVTSPQAIERLLRALLVSSACFLPVSVYATIHATVEAGFVGAGGITQLVPFAAGVALLVMGRLGFGAALILPSIINIAIALKRAVWVAVAIFPFLHLWLAGARLARLARLFVVLVVVGGFSFVGAKYLPKEANVDRIVDRAMQTEAETEGFTSGQAREDEVRSIYRDVVTRGDAFSVTFGRGLGATYTFVAEHVDGAVFHNYNNSHFSPMGWFLRGGLVGSILNFVFYVAAIVASVRCCLDARGDPEAKWRVTLTTYFILAFINCFSAFSMTPNVSNHFVLMLILMRSARPARAAAGARSAYA